jgi:hypothetical protein
MLHGRVERDGTILDRLASRACSAAELARALKAACRTRHLPVVAATNRRDGRPPGVSAVLNKPLRSSRLLAQLGAMSPLFATRSG